MEKFDKIYHISDIDMDGFSSQYMMKQINQNIKYYNPKRNDLSQSINSIFQDIVENMKGKKVLILITDLSLDDKIAKKLNNFPRGNKQVDISIKLLDHHKTGSDVAEKYDWYIFDNNQCSAKLTANFVNLNFDIDEVSKTKIKRLGDFVDSNDRWIEDHPDFDKASYLSEVMSNLKMFPEFLENEERDLLFHMIESIFNKYEEGLNTEEVEKETNVLILKHLKNKLPEEYLENKNISTLKKLLMYMGQLVIEKHQEYLSTIEVDGKKLLIFMNLSSSVNQQVPSFILNNTEFFDATANIKTTTGKVSFRARKGKADVGLIAKEHFSIINEKNPNASKIGGGHAGASGGYLDFSKDTPKSYTELIRILEKKFNIDKSNSKDKQTQKKPN